MKSFSLAALLLVSVFVPRLTLAQQTAYQALNVVGKSKGDAYLDQLLALDGRGGGGRPASWRLLFEDSSARGGLREIEVRDSAIAGQRTPLNNPYGNSTPINLNRLQLDSDGAWSVATRELGSASTADFLLQADGTSGLPVWRVQLADSSGQSLPAVRVSATDGAVLGSRQPVRPRDPGFVEGDEVPRESSRILNEPEEAESDNISPELKIHRTVVRAGRSVGNGFRRVGGSLQELFTGRRTIDSDLRDQ